MPSTLLRMVLVGALLVGYSHSVVAQTAPPDSVKRMASRRLLPLQHTDSLMLAGMDREFSTEATQPSSSGMPAGFLDSLRVRLRRDVPTFVERLVPVFDSLYTASEVDQMIV